MLGRVAAVLAAAAVLVAAPGIAQAAFTGTASSSLTVSSGLPAPTGVDVSASCPSGRKLSITVNNHGTVPRATSYSFNVVNPGGSVVPTSGWSYSTHPAASGVWTYQVRGLYTAGPGNVWSGQPYEGTITC